MHAWNLETSGGKVHGIKTIKMVMKRL